MLTGDMLRRSAERFPNKPAILWQDQAISYGDLHLDANRFANGLLGLGLAKEAKVAILSRNRIEYGTVFFGTARSGGVIVNISVLYTADDLAYVLDKADVEILVYEDVFAERVAQVAARLPRIRHYISLGADQPGATGFAAFIAGASAETPAVEIAEDDPFCMTYTGGTTGRPKGVLASHRNRVITAHTVMVHENIDERDVVGIVTPLFHVAALNIMFQPAILAGATCSLQTKWDVAEFARMAQRTGMTACFMVPTQVAMVVNDPNFSAANYLHWEKLGFAGAPMPDWVQRDLIEKLPALKLTQIYGQSEVGVITVLGHWHLPERLGSIGKQAYNTDLAVVDPEGNPVPAGEIGELVARGANVMLEYYNEPEQTAKFFRHGWGWTGDLAVMDEEGFVTLVDRSKDMIISGGENVYPKEIENAIYALPEIGECAVFGIPDDKWGEVPAAYIQLKAGTSLSVEQVDAHCEIALARFKRPRLVRFVESFPKTPIGKIQKNLLREPYWADREKNI
ncbi:class I adenylate-forming enzyme family protein [Pseudogemmobacter faecipullorum]|uniref:AMP-binding protein n=1 Tax=Pseudogemmobacter faecipullorum TaxID=2755041 RepID=A0ABS8CN10_9RHOB|nr:AMP-binding protein [Pseudogemmobacter faecipullorum]MCB5410779.1 AMP-binding protein [Pseudogemmobacter faecipullorum]